jgi:general secretion pathway protein L
MYSRGNAVASDIGAQLDAARTQAAAVEHLQNQLRGLAREQSFLAAQKQQPMLVASLAELSRLLPDGTWISDLQVTGKKVRLQGSSRSASHLIALIDGSSRFANAQFQAPVTRDAQANSERFDLSFEVVR